MPVKYFIKGNTDEAPVEGEFGNADAQARAYRRSASCSSMPRNWVMRSLLPCSMALDLLKMSHEDLDPVVRSADRLDQVPERCRRRPAAHVLSAALLDPENLRSAKMSVTKTIDARDTFCPGPLMELISYMKHASVGDVVELLSTDSGSPTTSPSG
jgi:hypothetical protein